MELTSFQSSWLLNGMKALWYFLFSFLFFCLEPTAKRNTWMRTISVVVMVIISKVLFWKLFDISKNVSDVSQSTFLTFTRHIGNVIWKTSFSCKICRSGATYVLILPWVNIMKRKWVKVPGKLSSVQKSEPVLRRTFDVLLYSFSLKEP